MATFKMGQRVRLTQIIKHAAKQGEFAVVPLKTEGTVLTSLTRITIPGTDYSFDGHVVRFDGIDSGSRPEAFPHFHGCFGCVPEQLAPLTDPGAAKFIESLGRLAREPQGVAPSIQQPVTK